MKINLFCLPIYALKRIDRDWFEQGDISITLQIKLFKF